MQATRKPACLLGLATLAALGLAAALPHPAAAQTLSGFKTGDSVTVSGGGTTGTYQGSPISTNVTTYTAASSPGAAVSVNNGAFNLESGGSLSGGGLAQGDGLDAGLNATSVGGTGDPAVLISGGTVSGFYAVNVGAGVTTITGGHITGGSALGFPLGAGLLAQTDLSDSRQSGVIDVYGAFTDHAPGSSVSGVGTGTVTGTLADGEPIATTYQVGGGVINFLSPAPEPSQFAGLGVGLLGLAGLALKARRRA